MDLLVSETYIYAQQSWLTFLAASEEMKPFLEVNFTMRTNEQPSISQYWDWNNTTGDNGIQNVFTRSHFQNILQTFHFAYDDTVDHRDIEKHRFDH